jgi:hypothetical protein
MLGTLSRLEDRCDLGVRGREQARDLLGQGLVSGEPGQLALPQVEIALGQPIDVGGIVIIGSHSFTIPHRMTAAFAGAKRSLSHCGIGAKVAAP